MQAQLTDNSWLLAPAVRLTGGFAFAAWFAGPNRGQFVLTLGGYHPDFHRDGYPVVPRLGLVWQLGDAISVIRRVVLRADLRGADGRRRGWRSTPRSDRPGRTWSSARDGIVFFDPFWLEVTVYASIDAGVTIDLWFGEITSRCTSPPASTVSGPPFHRRGRRFEVGPVGLDGGDRRRDRPAAAASPGTQFVRKYLEEAAPGAARVLAAVTGAGRRAAGRAAGTGGAAKRPDGSDATGRSGWCAEFELHDHQHGAGARAGHRRRARVDAGDEPRGLGGADGAERPRRRRWSRCGCGPAGGRRRPTGPDRPRRRAAAAGRLPDRHLGRGAGPQDDAKVPAGDVITATDRVRAARAGGDPRHQRRRRARPAIPYRQVETGGRAGRCPSSTEDAAARRQVLAAARLSWPRSSRRRGRRAAMAAAATLLAERGGRSRGRRARLAGGPAARAAARLAGRGARRARRSRSQVAAVAPRAGRRRAAALRPPRVLRRAGRAGDAPRTARQPLGAPGTAPERRRRPTTVSAELRERAATRALPRCRRRRWPAWRPGWTRAVPGAAAAGSAPPAARARRHGGGRRRAAADADRPLAGAETAPAAGGRRRPPASTALAALGPTRCSAATGAARRGGEVAVLELPDADARRRPAAAARRWSCRGGRARVRRARAAGRVRGRRPCWSDGRASRCPSPRRRTRPGRSSAARRGDAGAPGRGWVAAAGRCPALATACWSRPAAWWTSLGAVPAARGRARCASGWAAPAELLGGETRRDHGVRGRGRAVAVALERRRRADDLALGLDRARRRPLGADGRPGAAGGRRRRRRAPCWCSGRACRPGQPVAVTVATGEPGALAGVAAVRVAARRAAAIRGLGPARGRRRCGLPAPSCRRPSAAAGRHGASTSPGRSPDARPAAAGHVPALPLRRAAAARRARTR